MEQGSFRIKHFKFQILQMGEMNLPGDRTNKRTIIYTTIFIIQISILTINTHSLKYFLNTSATTSTKNTAEYS